MSARSKALTAETINEFMKKCRYEVRGEIYLAAVERANAGKEVIYTNVGNPQALGQVPLTFNRQVLSLLMAPFLMDRPEIMALYPADAIARARLYLSKLNGGVGAYSDAKGSAFIRQEVADFIHSVTGAPSDPNTIFLSNGASETVRMLLFATIRGPSDGVMVPIPQYPLYSATIDLYGGELVPYYLDEASGWGLDISELQRSLDSARAKGICVRAFVFINPGNPTGQCLTAENLQELIRFCSDNGLVMCADEVYQENVYNPARPFVSCRKVMHSMPAPYCSTEIASFHTVSKGAYGECGLRGGYMELAHMDPSFIESMYKVASINLCPNVPGQVSVGLMVNPPRLGEPSYALYRSEKEQVIDSLKRRARMMTDAFNSMEGVSCQETEGAMYAFPQITLPPAFVVEAGRLGKAPDVLYCLELLAETGLSCVPGSGFKQAPGTFHIRTTILPPEAEFQRITDMFKSFHEGFMRRYGGAGGKARL
ncbi:nicotinanamine aminotransferase A [Ochromonadaceae sp. CCMP2298]|nr:nicotinanamine aminotransferase A [Ochromonadaceae sp. CCMP2298]